VRQKSHRHTFTHSHHTHTFTPWRVPRGGGLEGRRAHGELLWTLHVLRKGQLRTRLARAQRERAPNMATPSRKSETLPQGHHRSQGFIEKGSPRGGVTWGFLSFLGVVSYRIRILMYFDVSCMYPDRILMCPVHIHQDTSRYIKIHQDTFVSVTLAIIGNVSYLGICILLYDTFRIHLRYI